MPRNRMICRKASRFNFPEIPDPEEVRALPIQFCKFIASFVFPVSGMAFEPVKGHPVHFEQNSHAFP